MVVLRILAIEGERLMGDEYFLEKMASFLVSEYFGKHC